MSRGTSPSGFSAKLRRAAGAAVRRLPGPVERRVRALAGGQAGGSGVPKPPRLSIVVPVYNVEEFLAATLDSLLQQTLGNWEAIVVDDGSTDSSGRIADAFAASDPRITVIHQPNAGLGAARNAGVARARGKYLTFLDSDDLIPDDAYAHALSVLKNTGSDFAIGGIERLRGERRYLPAWTKLVHTAERRAVTAEQFPDVVMDIVACNRVFSTEFWRTKIGEFPVGVAYEDHRVMVAAIVRARAFDVLQKTTYTWRVRDDESSISQQKRNLQNLRDRVRAKDETFAVLREEAPQIFVDAWLTRILDTDVPLFADHAAAADEEYRASAQSFARTYVAAASPAAWADVRWQQRVKTLLMAEGAWRELEEFSYRLKLGSGLPGSRVVGTEIRLEMASYPEPAKSALAGRDLLGPRLTRLIVRIDRCEWSDTGFEVFGFAYILAVAAPSSELILEFVNRRTGVRRAVDSVRREESSFVNRFANNQFFDYAGSGFAAVITWSDLQGMYGSSGTRPEDIWDLTATVRVGSLERSATVDTARRNGSAGFLRPSLIVDGSVSAVVARDNAVLSFTFREAAVLLTGADDDGGLCGQVDARLGESEPVWIGAKESHVALRPSGPTATSHASWKRLSFSGLSASETTRLRVGFADGSVRNVTWGLGAHGYWAGPNAAVARSPFGYVDLSPAEYALLALRAETEGDTLFIEVEGGAPQAMAVVDFELRHRSGAYCLRADRVAPHTGSTVLVEFDLAKLSPTGHSLQGRFDLHAAAAPVQPAESFTRTLPAAELTNRYRVEYQRATAADGRALRLLIGAPLREEEIGANAQQRLRAWYREADFSPERAVLFNCYRGETAADNQLAIHEELHRRNPQLPLYWAVVDGSVELPDGGIPVVINSRRWYELLGSVTHLCNNIDFDRYFVRRPYQRFLQTFHGHAFKAMGKTFWAGKGMGPRTIELEIERRREAWTALLMPDDESISYYKAEYDVDGEFLVTGYPRNDALVTGNPVQARRTVAEDLGLEAEPDRKWVLFAPTWRETAATGAWSAQMVDDLDLEEFARLLGSEWTVLVRGHNYNSREDRRVSRSAAIVDATDYPEINDLILASDCAVLDYSSLRFDWAITGKPVVFFVPDKTEYLLGRPGLFPFDESAPGPQVITTAGTAEAVLASDSYEASYGAELERFNARFNPLSDGQAAERVVDDFFADLLDDATR